MSLTSSTVRTAVVVLASLTANGLLAGSPAGTPAAAWPTNSGAALLKHIRVLAADEFEGRGPATPGEDKTVAYLTGQFRALGLKPGNPDGTWVQTVPMVGIQALEPSIRYEAGGQRVTLSFPSEGVIWSKRQVPAVSVTDSDVIFVGYGVVAPEYGWDDFKGVDVRGKTIVMLVNDPPVPDPKDPARLDPRMFKGRAMTYYGRWTYKFEIAAQKGAAAAILVHETGPAGYPWSVAVDSNSRENFDLQSPDRNLGRAAIEGWITREQGQRLCAAGGVDFDQLKTNAVSPGFRPVALGVKASFALKNRIRQVTSHNVVARLEGSDPKLRHECVIYTAHWDHLGQDLAAPGHPIYHGALDNASGVAGLLELARVFRQLPAPPKRSVLFLSVTAEEKGLLGSRYYAEHPLYPLAATLADLNMDGLNPWGRTADLQLIGEENSSLEELLLRAATAQGRTVRPESQPERGYFYRSDHFEFAKVGVPALYFKSGTNYVGQPAGFGLRKLEDYTAHDYHKPTDSVKDGWDFAGAVEDLRLLFAVGRDVADGGSPPTWKAGSEFRRPRITAPDLGSGTP